MQVILKGNYNIYLDTSKNRMSEDLLELLNKKTPLTFDQDINIDEEIDEFLNDNTEGVKVEEENQNIIITKDGKKLTYLKDDLKQTLDKMQKIKNNEKESIASKVLNKALEIKNNESIKKENDSITLTKGDITQEYNYEEVDELKDKLKELDDSNILTNMKEV